MDSIAQIIKKILFPRKCLGCGAHDTILCSSCLSLLPLRETVVFKQNQDYTEITLFPYSHKIVAKIIWELKYKNNTDLRRMLFERIGPRLELLIKRITPHSPHGLSIISVPKTGHDSKHRDFDHGFLLARALSPYLVSTQTEVLEGYLVKQGGKRQATLKHKHARLEAVKGTLVPTDRLRSRLAQDATLVIIDDVTTTGGTRDEMIRVLRPFFTGVIIFIALAH